MPEQEKTQESVPKQSGPFWLGFLSICLLAFLTIAAPPMLFGAISGQLRFGHLVIASTFFVGFVVLIYGRYRNSIKRAGADKVRGLRGVRAGSRAAVLGISRRYPG